MQVAEKSGLRKSDDTGTTRAIFIYMTPMMKFLSDKATRFHYFYSHALPPSGRASENVAKKKQGVVSQLLSRSETEAKNEETKTLAYCTDNGATVQWEPHDDRTSNG